MGWRLDHKQQIQTPVAAAMLSNLILDLARDIGESVSSNQDHVQLVSNRLNNFSSIREECGFFFVF